MYRVIIADDEPKVSQLIKNLIEWDSLGLELTATAQDGMAALEMIKQHQPDIVITDIRMPGYDGIELIKHAKEINPNIDFIIISGYQHFDYAHNAIKYGVKDYLLKPLNKNEINTALTKMVEKYSERSRQEMQRLEGAKRLRIEFVSHVYNGSDLPALNESDLCSINQDYDLNFIEGYYQALIIKPDFDYQPNSREIMRMLLAKVTKIIEYNLKGVCNDFLLLSLEDRIFIIANYKAADKKAFRKALNSIIDESHLFRDIIKNLIITIGIGNGSTSLRGIVISTVEAKAALSDRIILGAGRINQYNHELHKDKKVDCVVTIEKRRKLMDLVEILDTSEIRKWINEIEAEVQKLTDIPGQFILDTVEEIIEILLFVLKNHANLNTVAKGLVDEFKEVLQMQNSVRIAFETAGHYVERILKQVADEHKKESNRPIKEAQKYINEHFTSPVSLEEVSTIVGFNATYFSTLFKKETGMNFLEYVTTVRMKAAKQLLADSKKSILDISHEVGYSDFKHFTKQFKKITGLTPSEYRKLYY